MTRVAPVLHGSAKVHQRAFLHAARDLRNERVVLSLGFIERLVEVLPRRPGHAVRAAETVSRHAEVVDEASDTDSASAVSFLSDGETDRHGIARRHPALRAR